MIGSTCLMALGSAMVLAGAAAPDRLPGRSPTRHERSRYAEHDRQPGDEPRGTPGAVDAGCGEAWPPTVV